MDLIENVKNLAGLVKKYQDQELYQILVELREQIIQLKEENISLKEENGSLKQKLKTVQEIERIGNSYFLKNDTKREQPFCLPCWDYDGKLVSQIVNKNSHGTFVSCSICAARKKNTLG